MTYWKSWHPGPSAQRWDSAMTPGHVGLGLGLAIGAGLATTLGALLLFIPCIKKTNTRILAISLSLAAGVMLYISFTEIFQKAQANFCCLTQDHFDLVATVCFFGGILLTILLDLLVGGLQKLECGCCCCCSLPSRLRGWSLFKGEESVRSSPVHIASQMENGGFPGSVTYGAATSDITALDVVPKSEGTDSESSTSSEEALGPKEFQEMTEGLHGQEHEGAASYGDPHRYSCHNYSEWL
jgi:zinc transporter ZupT